MDSTQVYYAIKSKPPVIPERRTTAPRPRKNTALEKQLKSLSPEQLALLTKLISD